MPSGASIEPKRPLDVARLELARLNPGPDLSLDEIFRRICRTASEALDVARVGIWFFSGNRQALRCACLYEQDSSTFSAGVTLQVGDFPAYFAAMEQRRSIPAEVATDDPRTRQLADCYLKPLGISSLLDAPIIREGQTIGVVCHEHAGPPREWSTEERDFASSMADCVTLKLKSADLNEARAVLQQTDGMLSSFERAESLARLAAEAAHDFRNILTVIIGFADELTRAEAMPQNLREMAEHILKAGERGAELVRQLSAFGRTEANAPEAVSIGDVAERIQPLLRTAAGPNCRIQLAVKPHLGRVFIDPALLERVFLNLLTNARDAMPAGGVVEVRIESDVVHGDPMHVGAYAMVSVTDTGTGMDETTRDRMFEPFFTTKPRGHGTGLGMAIVRRIVERAGGFIRVETEPGRGTTIRVFLPFVSRG